MIGILGLALTLPHLATQLNPVWAPKGMADEPDSHVAFRGTFRTGSENGFFRIIGASEYLVWLDGKLVHDGPPRYDKAFPEFQTIPFSLPIGRHTLAVHVRNNGVTTRIMSDIPPFLACNIFDGEDLDAVEWKCARIPGYQPRVRRISDILGWIDWCDTVPIWRDWQGTDFDDSKWVSAVSVNPGIGPITEAKTMPVRMNDLAIKPMASGKLIATYGYERDDPAVRFFLDELDPKGVPAQGVWRRYDLGRVRLGRPKVTLDLPKGAIVEFALCEELRHGRVHPWLNLSGSSSCNMDHFAARGGVQEFMPFTPKGGRFLEVHIKTPSEVKFIKEAFLERTYFPEPQGSFTCDDPLLNKIWQVGVDTVRACSEDSFVDCPTRERGQWTGDVASVATDIAAVAWDDLSLSRRALVQAGQSARSDGLVAGVGPGDPGYLSTYAAQWVTACIHYWELTGDKSLLVELLPAARKNMAAFQTKTGEHGVSDDLGWAFVDWGYVRNEGPADMALNIHYLMALRNMVRWEKAVGNEVRLDECQRAVQSMETIIKKWIDAKLNGGGSWLGIGYHHAALSLLANLVPENQISACIAAMKTHIMQCFPNNPKGPRLSDPSVANSQILTPYFGHFAFAALLKHGEARFVLNQYRKCWGWALGDNRTTWLEVFDTRWSHCHEWSGCPTWQLSRKVLGLNPRFDLGGRVYEVNILTGDLKRVEGDIPIPGGGNIHVSWVKNVAGIELEVRTTKPIQLRLSGQKVEVMDHWKETIPAPPV
jgi:alpha-L-rhamnosidase